MFFVVLVISHIFFVMKGYPVKNTICDNMDGSRGYYTK